MWRIVAVSIGGAVTIASRFVTWESVSVVTRIASSTSRRTSDSASGGAAALAGQQPVDEVAVAGSVGTRPAEVCGCCSRPSSSRLASSCRIVEGPQAKPADSDLGAHGRAAGEVLLDDAPQNQFLALAQHPTDSRSGLTGRCRAGRPKPRSSRDRVADQARVALHRLELGGRDAVGDRLDLHR